MINWTMKIVHAERSQQIVVQVVQIAHLLEYDQHDDHDIPKTTIIL